MEFTSHIHFETDPHKTGGGQEHFQPINFVDNSPTIGIKHFHQG